MRRSRLPGVMVLLGVVALLALAWPLSAASSSLLFEASLRNGDYGGGEAIDTMGPDHGGSPHELGIVNSAEGTTFTSTESDGRSNALINWQIGDNPTFRRTGTVAFTFKADRSQHVGGEIAGDNYGFDQFNNGQSTFSIAAYRIANGEGGADDQVRIAWATWHNDTWYHHPEQGIVLEYDRWYNIGFAWGGPNNDFEIWVDGTLTHSEDLPSGVSFPWGLTNPPSGYNFGLGDNHQRGYDAYGSASGVTFADIRIWDEYVAESTEARATPTPTAPAVITPTPTAPAVVTPTPTAPAVITPTPTIPAVTAATPAAGTCVLEHIFNAGINLGWAVIHGYWYVLDTQPPAPPGVSSGSDIISDLERLKAHLKASGFPFQNYEAPIDSVLGKVRSGVRTQPEIPEAIWTIGTQLQAQLVGKTCQLPTGEVVMLEHIFNAGINLGWGHIRGYWYVLDTEPAPPGVSSGNDIISDLGRLKGHLEASGFPFQNYEAPIDSVLGKVRSGVRTLPEIPEAIWAIGTQLQAQLAGKTCQLFPGPRPTVTPGPLPARFDWRDYSVVPPVRDQAACGSCWAHSAAGAVEGTYCVEQNEQGTTVDLSEQNLVSDCCAAGSCTGGWPERALEYIRTSGIVDEGCFAYQSQRCKYTDPTTNKSLCCDAGAAATFGCTVCTCPDGTTCSNPCPCVGCADWNSRLWRIQRWQQVPRTVNDVKTALVANGPLSVTSIKWGHAVVLVGYDDNSAICRARYGQNGCWIIRNSWGLFNGWAGIGQAGVWHVDGYAYIPYTGHTYSDLINGVYFADGVVAP